MLNSIPYRGHLMLLEREIIRSIIKYFDFIQHHWRLFIFKNYGIVVDSSCLIGNNVITRLGYSQNRKGTIKIDAKTQICDGTILDCWGGEIEIGENVFLGPYTVIYGHGGVKIGKDTLIAMHCRIVSSNHTIPNRNVSIRSCSDILLPVTIGEDVWLGAGVTILGGVTVGKGCVVGAGAVVTKDLPPYSVAMGVPAQVVRTRQ